MNEHLKEYTALGTVRVVLSVKAASQEDADRMIALAFSGCQMDDDSNVVAESDVSVDSSIPEAIGGVSIDFSASTQSQVLQRPQSDVALTLMQHWQPGAHESIPDWFNEDDFDAALAEAHAKRAEFEALMKKRKSAESIAALREINAGNKVNAATVRRLKALDLIDRAPDTHAWRVSESGWGRYVLNCADQEASEDEQPRLTIIEGGASRRV